jgi:hypothetical protein
MMNKMLNKLLMNDIRYYWFVFTMMSIPLIIFTILGLMDVQVNMTVEFLNKYFWPLTIGLGSYFLIYGMHVNKYKEKHDRLHSYLPIHIKTRAIHKFVFGVLPIIMIVTCLEILRYVLPVENLETIRRIDAQLSFLFIFLGIMSSSYDFIQCPTKRKKRSRQSVLIVLILSLSSAGFILLVASEIIPPIIKGRDEIYFYLWGVLMAMVASIIYYKRNSFV